MEILWSPNHEDKFLTFSSDLSLYKVEPWQEGMLQTQRISQMTAATLLAKNSDSQYLKCVGWYPHTEPDHLIAIGQANGRILLTSLASGVKDPQEIIGKEFIPRHVRQCNMLTWNPGSANLLAAGMDKYRSDYCILIWDVFTKSLVDKNSTPERRSSNVANNVEVTSNVISKPLYELGLSETVMSITWHKHEPRTLVAGMNNKHIKIFDLRDPGRSQNTTLSKAVYGANVDPFNEYRIASYVDMQAVIWDTRNFDKPVLTLTENRPITKVCWSPTRNGLLSTLSRDSSILKLYDVQHVTIGDEVEPAIIERVVQPYGQHAIASFSWHPTKENRLLSITPSGTVRDTTVFERITLNWSPRANIVWACGRKLHHYDEESDVTMRCDISTVMKKRAVAGYGLKTEHLFENAGLVGNDIVLMNVWSWLDLVKSVKEDSRLKFNCKLSGYKLQGVKAVLKGELLLSGYPNKSESVLVQWTGLERLSNMQVRQYRNETRDAALLLCGWGFDKNGASLNDFLDRLQSDGHYERAAAIALFNLRIVKAIEILSKACENGSNADLNIVAMALSGFTEDKKTLWRDMCSSLRTRISSAYIRSMFAFLTADGDYSELMSDNGIALQDKMAIACLYLSDIKMLDYLERMITKTVEEGNLDGILLTGLTKEGIDLLQNYVDVTGDVQSACFIMSEASGELLKDERVKQWIESYRDLLDVWQLWHQRALFDVHWYRGDTVRPSQQVTVNCNFCGKPISSTSQGRGQRRPFIQYTTRTPPNKSKITCCPGCRKPLPRCALCLMHMGTTTTGSQFQPRDGKLPAIAAKENKTSHFSNWFTWCQSCRHGGHADHITDWFREHVQCPVTGCNCKCMTLDPVCKLQPLDSQSEQSVA